MHKPKKVPMRMCVGCREMKPKASLLRVVKPQEEPPRIDFTLRAAGRGAYVCKSTECLAKAKKTKALERAFESPVSEEVYAQLSAQIASLQEKQ